MTRLSRRQHGSLCFIWAGSTSLLFIIYRCFGSFLLTSAAISNALLRYAEHDVIPNSIDLCLALLALHSLFGVFSAVLSRRGLHPVWLSPTYLTGYNLTAAASITAVVCYLLVPNEQHSLTPAINILTCVYIVCDLCFTKVKLHLRDAHLPATAVSAYLCAIAVLSKGQPLPVPLPWSKPLHVISLAALIILLAPVLHVAMVGVAQTRDRMARKCRGSGRRVEA